MTQELYQKAMKFAGEKHRHQKVPGTGANYLLHLSNVAMEVLIAYHHVSSFDLDFAVQVAILHDTIEDTEATYEEIREVFGEAVAEGVQALTKNDQLATKQEKMMDSLSRIKAQPKEVGMVKLADRITNLQPPPANWSKDKIDAYHEEAKLIAVELVGKHSYLNQRLLDKIDTYLR